MVSPASRIVLASGLLSLVCSLSHAVVYVDQNAPGPEHDGASWDTAFLTIQEGVDAATPDGEVWVADGTYFENVVMGKGVQLYGGFLGAEPAGYEESLDQRDFENNITTIDGNRSGSCVVMAPRACVDGFTVTNGSGTLVWDSPWGGAFYCSGLGATGTIANNVIKGNRARGGGAICCKASSPLVADNVIGGNHAYDFGGGIYCSESSPVIQDNVIADGTAMVGGGIYCRDCSSPLVVGNAIVRNSTPGVAGGLFATLSSSPTVVANVIAGNSAAGGAGAGLRCDGGSPVICANTIHDNHAGRALFVGGGGIDCDDAHVLIAHNDIVDNDSGAGGGISCGYCTGLIADNIIACNVVSGGGWWSSSTGGGLSCCGAELVVVNNTLVMNEAEAGGGGICARDPVPLLANNTVAFCSSGILFPSAEGEGVELDLRNNCVFGNEEYDYAGIDDPTGRDGNISVDPLLVDPEGGDFHLLPWSPCIDAGDNAILEELAELLGIPVDELTDIDGEKRLVGSAVRSGPRLAVDIGADEFHPHGSPFR